MYRGVLTLYPYIVCARASDILYVVYITAFGERVVARLAGTVSVTSPNVHVPGGTIWPTGDRMSCGAPCDE